MWPVRLLIDAGLFKWHGVYYSIAEVEAVKTFSRPTALLFLNLNRQIALLEGEIEASEARLGELYVLVNEDGTLSLLEDNDATD